MKAKALDGLDIMGGKGLARGSADRGEGHRSHQGSLRLVRLRDCHPFQAHLFYIVKQHVSRGLFNQKSRE